MKNRKREICTSGSSRSRSLGCLSLTLSEAWMRPGCSRPGDHLAGVRSQRMPPRFVSHRRAFAGRPHAAPPVSSPGLRARQGLAAVNGKMAIQSRRAGGDRLARDCKNGRKCLHSAAARGCRGGPKVVGAFVGTIAAMAKTPMMSTVNCGDIVRHPPLARPARPRGGGGVHMEMSSGGGSL